MAKNNRIFISFAIEDEWARTYLVGQARNEKSPFSFVDMSVKEPWSSDWKNKCRTKIKGCDGMIAMVSKNTIGASGQLFEVRVAIEEKIPVLGIYVSKDDRPYSLPVDFFTVPVKDWSWPNISSFINSL